MLKVFVCALTALAWVGAASAADLPQYGPAPAWVKSTPIPKKAADADGAAVQVLLQNSQTLLGPDVDQFYQESAAKILSAQGLAAWGNIILAWKPDTDTLIIHRLEIIRGDQVIDVLEGGKTVTVLRRETNLELAMLDGSLTATVQPEGLQVGDVIHIAYTLQRRDPVFQGRSEGLGALSRPGVVGRAYTRVIWPKSKTIRWRTTDGFGTPTVSQSADGEELLVDSTNVEAPKAPRDAPPRFNDLAQIEFSQFSSWSDVSALMAPLYLKASTLAPTSPLMVEVQKIKSANADPKAQAMAALRLVEDQTRYVFLGMDHGGYVPVDADTTWARRFGDCKGKSVLLLALLRALGIDAEPALVSTTEGDGLAQRLPLLEVFDHVIVRAQIGGKIYWLDGTRLGDRTLDDLPVPDYRWVLPLQLAGGELVKVEPAPYTEPHFDSTIRLDASAGLDLPAPAHADHVFRGEEGLGMHLELAAISHADADRYLKDYWRRMIPWIEPRQVNFAYDEATGVSTLSMDGVANVDWAKGDSGRDFDVADSSLGERVNYQREPGPHQDAPYAVAYPMFKKWTVIVQLPNKGEGFTLVNGEDVDKAVAGVEYQRASHIENGVASIEASERALTPEFSASDTPAASAGLRELADYDVVIRAPSASGGGSSAQDPAVKAEQLSLADAASKAQNGDTEGSLAELKTVAAAPTFAQLTAFQREAGLMLLSALALQARDYPLAHTTATQLTEMVQAIATQPGQNNMAASGWSVRLASAGALRDYDDAAFSLTNIIRTQPSVLPTMKDATIFELAAVSHGDRRFDMLLALHEAHWRPKSASRDASSLWLDLATALIERGLMDQAKAVAEDIDAFSPMIVMHADKRFDAIVAADPAKYDVSKALDRNLADLRAASLAAPNKLEDVNALANALILRNRAADALVLLDGALAKAHVDVGGASYFTDVDEQINHSEEDRGIALQRLGRSDEALKAMEHAAAHAENGGANVSQTLDLAERYVSLGRARDALDDIDDFDPRHASPYGLMVWESARACAYAQLNDQANLATPLQYLREHAKDGSQLFEVALLCAHDSDAVAKEIVARLVDPDTRQSKLAEIQDYLPEPGQSPWDKDITARWLVVRGRPDVQAAIAKVGRIESYPIIR